MFQVHKNVQPTLEQLNYHWGYVDVQQCHIPRSQQSDDQYKHVSLHLCCASVVADGWIFIGVWCDVLENLEGALDFHGHHHQQKSKLGVKYCFELSKRST